jgi:hypothetical protein
VKNNYTSKKAGKNMSIRLGDDAPNFPAQTTQGEINFHEYPGSSQVILFSLFLYSNVGKFA